MFSTGSWFLAIRKSTFLFLKALQLISVLGVQ